MARSNCGKPMAAPKAAVAVCRGGARPRAPRGCAWGSWAAQRPLRTRRTSCLCRVGGLRVAQGVLEGVPGCPRPTACVWGGDQAAARVESCWRPLRDWGTVASPDGPPAPGHNPSAGISSNGDHLTYSHVLRVPCGVSTRWDWCHHPDRAPKEHAGL